MLPAPITTSIAKTAIFGLNLSILISFHNYIATLALRSNLPHLDRPSLSAADEDVALERPNYVLYSALYKTPIWHLIQPVGCIMSYIFHILIIQSPPICDKK